MKLTQYTSILTAAMLLAGTAQALPVTAVTAAAPVSAVTAETTASAGETTAVSADSSADATAAETAEASAESTVSEAVPQTTAAAEDSTAGTTVTTVSTEPSAAAEGSLGESVTWQLDTAGHLIIRGAGAMYEAVDKPFGSYTGSIKDAVIENTDPENPITSLAASLFKGCGSLASVTLPDSVQTIGSFAFRGCSALTAIELPEHLAEIGEQAFRESGLTKAVLPGCTLGKAAFYNCDSLKEVSIGEGTVTVPAECFRYCDTLKSVRMPDSVKEILRGNYESEGAFADCPLLRSVSIGTGIETISEFAFRTAGTELEVTFREGVTAIPASAFDGRKELTSVILPKSVTSVGAFTFRNCVNLTGTVFPESIKEIGEQAFRHTGLTEAALPGCKLGSAAFYECQALKTLVINEGTEVIPAECFRGCIELESAMLPDSLKKIKCGEYESQGSFADCPKLCDVSIGKGIESISPTAFRTTGTALAVTFREGVTDIPATAFDGRTELVSVSLPETLESIGYCTFRDCPNLTGTVFPASLSDIGWQAFRNTGLTEAVLPGCALGNQAFYECRQLKTVVINEGTEIIPDQCFRYCDNLKSVRLPDSLKEIGCGEYESQGSFADCPQLTDVSIGKGIELISEFAFRTTGTELAVTFREGVTAIPAKAFDSRNELTSVTLPETLKTIGSYAFRRCVKLTGVSFPSSLREIGEEAFRRTKLTEAELPGCALGSAAFYECPQLKTLVIGEGTEIIPSECFKDCSELENVWLPDSLREIQCGDYNSQGAFAVCNALKTVSIGKGIEKIDNYSFSKIRQEDCPDLEVTFREGVTAIPAEAFANTLDLISVKLPETLETIGEQAFLNCRSLTGVVFPDSIKEIGRGAFDNTGLKEAILPGCTLGRGVFWNCEQLETVVIGEGTEIIPEACFRYCRNLKSVMLPDSVKEIRCGSLDSDGAFADCDSLETVSIGAGIEMIDSRAFRTESKYLDITFREGAEAIPDSAFKGRDELVRLVVPESAGTLGASAVRGCDNLRTIVFLSPGCVIPDDAKSIPENAVIYGWNKSTAQDYADKYGRAFVPLRTNDPSVPFVCDLNLDGRTDSADAELLFRIVAEAPIDGDTLDFDALYSADLDCSGTLTIEDVTLMLGLLPAADQPLP